MKYAVRLRMLLFLSIGALSLLLWSGSTQAAPPTGDSKTFVFDSSTITNTDYDTPFTGVYYVAPNGASTPAAIDYYYRPGGTAENIDTNVVAGTTGTPPLGASSWQSTALPDNGDGKIEILIHPDEIFGGAYTLADVQELSWETNKPGAIGDQDWYVNVWLDASGDTNADATTSSNDVAFLSGEPYWTSNNGSYASNTWTQWVADDTAGGNFEVNFHEPGYACTTFGWAGPEMPSLDQLTGGPYTWQGVPEIGFGAFGCPGNNGTVNSTIDYASMPILGISIATGNPWADTFNGYLDNFRIELNDGGQTNRIVVDFEDAQLQNEPTIDKAFSPNNILAGGVSTLDFTLDNSNATPLSDVNFTDNLPAGVVVAGTPNVSNACGGTVTAVAGSGTISLAGGYLDESANCIVSVDVTAATAGTYNNTSDPVGTNTENTAFANGTDTASATLNVSNAPTPQTIVVDPTNDQGWLFDNPVYCTPGTTPASAPYDPCSVTGGGAPIAGDFELGTDTEAGQGFEVGPGTPPEGNGSYFAEIYDGGSKVIAARNDYNNASFSGLIGMSIATYLDPSSGDNSNWYVNLYVDQDGDGGYDCRLDGTVPTQAAGSWQTTDLYNESWSGCSFTGTLSAFTAANPNAQLVSGFNATGFPQIIINQGDTADNYEGYVGNFDAFRLSHVDQGDITWDFEPEPADLAVTKSVALTNDLAGNSTYDPGDTINYTVTVTNNGPSDTTNVEIADALPGDLTLVVGDTSATQGSYDGTTWTVGNLTSGSSETLTIAATVNSGTENNTVTNTASVSTSDFPDNNPSNDTDEASFTVAVPEADLDVDKTVSLTNDVDDDGAYDPGDTLEYTITVTNTGSQNTTNVEITDTLPASLTLDSSNASQGNYNGTTWTVGTLNVGDSATLTITAAINSGTEGADITNTAEVSNSDVVDNNTANNSASITITVGTDDVVDDGGDGGDDGAAAPVINVFDPAISKVGFLQPGEVGVTGETLDWSITVTNQGDAAGENVVITDTLIDALAPENVTTTKGTTNISGQTVTVNIGTLNPGETVNITITTTVLEGVQVDNTACLTANGVDQLCTQAGAGVVSALPATGETPWWRSWVVAALSLLGIGVAAGVVVKRRAPHAQH